MGEDQRQPFQLSFNRLLRVGFQGSKVTSNGGLILVRELDERLGLGELVEEHLTDFRASNARCSFADLLPPSVHSRLAGLGDVNDAERLSRDPSFRLIGSEKVWDRVAALTSRLQTFETEMLVDEKNFAALARINRELIAQVEARDAAQRVFWTWSQAGFPFLQQRLVKTGGRLIKHARYYWLLLAEGHLARRLFASMLGRTDGLPLPSG